MRALLRTTPWLLAILLLDVASAVVMAQTPVPVTDPTRRVYVFGASALPPHGSGWVVSVDPSNASTVFGRQLGTKTRTSVASIATEFLANPPQEPDSLREWVIRSLEPEGGKRRIQRLSFQINRDLMVAPLCFRFRVSYEDHDVPHHKGQRFLLSDSGIRFLHPQIPNLLVAVDYSERCGPDDAPPDSTDANSFLDGLQLTRRDTTLGQIVSSLFDVDAVEFAHGSIWATRHRYRSLEGADAETADEVVRIDPATRAITARIPIAKAPWDLVGTENAMWVTTGGDHPGIQKIDVATNRVTATVSFGKSPRFVAYGSGSLWVTDAEASKVWRIDAQSGRLQGNGTPGLKRPACITFAEGRVWVADRMLRQLVSIDPVSGLLDGSPIGIGGSPFDVAAGAGSLWVLSGDMKAIQRIDPTHRTIVATIPLASPDPNFLAIKNSVLWVADYELGCLTRIDTQTNHADSPAVPAGVSLGRMAVSDSSLWISDRAMGTLIVISR